MEVMFDFNEFSLFLVGFSGKILSILRAILIQHV